MPETPEQRKANYVGGRPKDESTLSNKPSQIRNRLRRTMARPEGRRDDGRLKRDVEALYQKPMEDWDFEELARGRPRDRRGKFAGPMPIWCTPLVQQEAKKRLFDATFGDLASHAQDAIKAIAALITSNEVDDKGRPIVDARTRLAASQFVLENIIGKPKAIVEVQATDFTRQAIAAAIVLDDGMPEDHFVLDGTVVVEEEVENDNG